MPQENLFLHVDCAPDIKRAAGVCFPHPPLFPSLPLFPPPLSYVILSFSFAHSLAHHLHCLIPTDLSRFFSGPLFCSTTHSIGLTFFPFCPAHSLLLPFHTPKYLLMTPSMLSTVVPGSKLVPSHLQYKCQEQPATFNPNRLSLPNANVLRLQQQAQQQQPPKPSHKQLFLQQLQQQQQQQIHMYEKSAPASKPRLSLDTSDERLQNITFVSHNNKRYMKLFSPSLVESPVTFLDKKQLMDDKKLWESGPDMAFQKQLEAERRDAYRGKKRLGLSTELKPHRSLISSSYPSFLPASCPFSLPLPLYLLLPVNPGWFCYSRPKMATECFLCSKLHGSPHFCSSFYAPCNPSHCYSSVLI